MPKLTRITRDARVMGGKPCIRGMRVTVGTIVGLVAAGHTTEEILRQEMAELYRQKVTALAQALEQPETRTLASEALRGLIDAIVLTPDKGGLRIELSPNV